MDPQTIERQNRQAVSLEPSRRRSMRVLLSVPIRVKGTSAANEEFEEQARTLVVNAHGALISLQTPVVPNQSVSIGNKATNQWRECRIVHVGTQSGGKMQVGVEFTKPSPSFWQIDFPPDDWVIPES